MVISVSIVRELWVSIGIHAPLRARAEVNEVNRKPRPRDRVKYGSMARERGTQD